MMDPILDPEERELEDGLMRAGRNVGMSSDLREKTLAALAAGAVGVTAASTAKAGTWGWLSSKAAGLWVAGIVAVGGTSAIVASTTDEQPPRSSSARTVPAMSPVGVAAPADSPPPQDKGNDAKATETAETLDGSSQRAATPEPKAPASTKRNAEAPNATNTLRDELSHISQVEAALQAGNARKALGLLTEYRQRFTERRLGLEAEILTIQALHKSGSVAEARARAQRFVDAHPKSPLGTRAKQFLK